MVNKACVMCAHCNIFQPMIEQIWSPFHWFGQLEKKEEEKYTLFLLLFLMLFSSRFVFFFPFFLLVIPSKLNTFIPGICVFLTSKGKLLNKVRIAWHKMMRLCMFDSNLIEPKMSNQPLLMLVQNTHVHHFQNFDSLPWAAWSIKERERERKLAMLRCASIFRILARLCWWLR